MFHQETIPGISGNLQCADTLEAAYHSPLSFPDLLLLQERADYYPLPVRAMACRTDLLYTGKYLPLKPQDI